ncbi:hypothetical protein Hanom_Chr05g00424261 [Helianthus anomalus]
MLSDSPLAKKTLPIHYHSPDQHSSPSRCDLLDHYPAFCSIYYSWRFTLDDIYSIIHQQRIHMHIFIGDRDRYL